MSLLSPERLRIGLCADRVVCARANGVRAPGAGNSALIALEDYQGAADWRTAVGALPRLFERCRSRKPHVTLIISNAFARYAVLPWHAGLTKAAEWLALAQHRLREVHGAAVDDWTIRVAETAPRGPRVVSAIETAFLAALDPAIAACGGRLVSVQPHLMTVFNRVRPQLGAGACWLVIEDAGRLTLALVRNGAWEALRTRRAGDRWRITLPEIIARESAMLGLEEPCTRVAVYTAQAFNAGIYDGLEVRDVTPPSCRLPADRELAMVMV